MVFDETLKMMVFGFEDAEFSTPAKVQPFKVHVNPENYTQSVAVNFSNKQALGSSGAANNYHNTEPQILRFDFLLDRTGALGNEPDSDGVNADIEHFKKLALYYNESIHRPRFLKLVWGKLLFNCQLQNLDVEYKMFSSKGVPLRAILKVVFKEFQENNKRNIKENKNSPDLTHVYTVQEGDKLPLITHHIYGDAKYYLEVARVNNLTDFRNLKPGSEIIFPPLKKTN